MNNNLNKILNDNKKMIFIILKVLCVLACCFYLRRIYTHINNHSGVLANVYTLTLILSTLGVVLYVLSLFKEIKIEKLFLIIAGIFGGLLMILLPVRVAPDETKHAMTSYKISDWILQTNQTDDDFFYIRSCDMEFFDNDWNLEWDPTQQAYEEYYSKAFNTNKNETLIEADLSMGLNENYISYVFSSLGITVGRLLHMNGFWTLMMGRIFNFIIYLLMVYLSIKIIPVGKQLMMTIAVFPISLQQGMSYSYDSPIFAASFFLIATSIYIYYNGTKDIKHKILLYITMLLCSLLLIIVKSHAYIFVGLFPLVAIFKQLRILNKTTFKWIVRILLVIIGLIFIAVVVDKFLGFPTIIKSADELYSLGWLINHPYKTFCLYIDTFKELGTFYYFSMISAALGWLNLDMPSIILKIYTLILVFNFFQRDTDTINVDGTIRLFSLGTFAVTLLCIMLGMLMFWTPKECTTIGGVQGRYLIPIFYLACVSLRVNKIKIPSKLDILSNAGIICSLLMVVNILANRF